MILALFLLAQPIPSPAPVTGAKAPAEIWEQRCTVCHGADGRGHTKKGRQLKSPDMTRPRWQAHLSDEKIANAIANGVKKRKMPAFKDKLSKEEIQALVPYIRALGGAAR
jgi:mono/diheme cytochrome c family protein